MKALLDYMYHGEVSIEEEELQGKNFFKFFFILSKNSENICCKNFPSFSLGLLKVAEALKVKGKNIEYFRLSSHHFDTLLDPRIRPYHWVTDPGPALFFSCLQDVNKKICFFAFTELGYI